MPRKLKRGTCCSTDQSSLPLVASKPCSRPSTERMTTTFSLIAGADSSSELTCDAPQLAPGRAVEGDDRTLAGTDHHQPEARRRPGRQGSFSFLTQTWRPVSRSTASTSPLCEAANTMPLSTAGPKPRRSFTCFLPPPTPSPQSFFTGSVCRKFDQVGRRLDIFVLAAAGRDQQRRESQREAINASGFGLVRRSAALARSVPWARSDRQFSVQQGAESTPPSCRRRRAPPCTPSTRAADILLGVVGVAAHFVVAAPRKLPGVIGERLDRIVGLALIDQDAREAQARDMPSSVSLELSMTCVSGAIAFAILPLVDGEARQRQLRLVGIRRGRIVLDEAVGDLPRLCADRRSAARRAHVVELRSGLQGALVS